MREAVTLFPVAFVRNGVTSKPDDWETVRSELVFYDEYVDGLMGIENLDYLWVIFGFHLNEEVLLRVHPRNDPDNPLVGVFASRSPTRPSKLGLTKVRVVAVEGHVVTVTGLDAFDGTPVYDVKPGDVGIDYTNWETGKVDKQNPR
jgi:tRNA-Thr(GGU) m(6)t(6)A37 methyltransferase TsaA